MATRRELLVTVGFCALGTGGVADAQSQPSVRRIGFLGARSRSTQANPDDYYDAFMQGMRELGYVEGRNLVVEWRFAEGKYELLPALAAELVRLNVELIVTHSTPATREAQRATSVIPIVTAASLDVISSGFAKSLSRPGGNITGLTLMVTDLTPKQVELIKTIVPRLSRLAVLTNSGNTAHHAFVRSVQAASAPLLAQVVAFPASTAKEIELAFALMGRENVGAAVIAPDGFFIGQRRVIALASVSNRIPSVSAYREDVQAGSLMSYGQNTAEFYRRAATYVDKVLKGAKPSELPIEQPMTIHLAINNKTAKALGLSITKELLLRADEVIE